MPDDQSESDQATGVTNSLNDIVQKTQDLTKAAERYERAQANAREFSNHRTENECTFYCRSCTNTFTRWLPVVPNRARCKCGSERTVLIGLEKAPY